MVRLILAATLSGARVHDVSHRVPPIDAGRPLTGRRGATPDQARHRVSGQRLLDETGWVARRTRSWLHPLGSLRNGRELRTDVHVLPPPMGDSLIGWNHASC